MWKGEREPPILHRVLGVNKFHQDSPIKIGCSRNMTTRGNNMRHADQADVTAFWLGGATVAIDSIELREWVEMW